MPTYTTEYIRNLSTGEPFVFEVPQETLDRFELQKKVVAAGDSPLLGKDIRSFTENFEVSLFPARKVLLKIWTENGFTTELILQILRDFGVAESFIEKLLEDRDYLSKITPWFGGITRDGGRATRNLKAVYDITQSYFSPTGKSEWEYFTDFP